MKTTLSRVLAVIAAATVLTPVLPVSAAPSAAIASNDFYQPPSTLPGRPGAFIKSQNAPLAIGFSGTARRIMYTSTLTSGALTAVTGALYEPSAQWSGNGPRPTVIVASGTIGQGDQCAPSKFISTPVSFDLSTGSTGFHTEVTTIFELLSQGFRVMETDYIGLGTPGIHTYANRLEQGHAVLDGARAALAADGLPADSPVGLWGYSQGGGASASAAELASTYAPDINVRGTYTGAPPANLAEVTKLIDGTSIMGAIGYTVNGLYDRYPAIRNLIDSEVNATGRAALDTLSHQCIADTALQFGFHHTSEWTKSGESVAQLLSTSPEAQAVVDQQLIGRLKPNAPVLLNTGINDDLIPYGQAVQMAEDWQALGADVTIRSDQTPVVAPKTATNHLLTDAFGLDDALTFMRNQFNRN